MTGDEILMRIAELELEIVELKAEYKRLDRQTRLDLEARIHSLITEGQSFKEVAVLIGKSPQRTRELFRRAERRRRHPNWGKAVV